MDLLWGWKDFAKSAKVSIKTLKTWHYKKRRIPFSKTSNKKQGKICISVENFTVWLNGILERVDHGNH